MFALKYRGLEAKWNIHVWQTNEQTHNQDKAERVEKEFINNTILEESFCALSWILDCLNEVVPFRKPTYLWQKAA